VFPFCVCTDIPLAMMATNFNPRRWASWNIIYIYCVSALFLCVQIFRWLAATVSRSRQSMASLAAVPRDCVRTCDGATVGDEIQCIERDTFMSQPSHISTQIFKPFNHINSIHLSIAIISSPVLIVENLTLKGSDSNRNFNAWKTKFQRCNVDKKHGFLRIGRLNSTPVRTKLLR
jgi:hypothetical protein